MLITNTMAYWYDGAALAATRSPVIALFWCLIKFTTTTTTTKTTRYLIWHYYLTSHINDLNLKLQGKSKLFPSLVNDINAFNMK